MSGLIRNCSDHDPCTAAEYTSLRRGDAVRLGRQHIRDGVAAIKTEKGGFNVAVMLPILPALADSLAAGPCGDSFGSATVHVRRSLFRKRQIGPGDSQEDAGDDAQEDDHGPNMDYQASVLVVGHAAQGSSAGRLAPKVAMKSRARPSGAGMDDSPTCTDAKEPRVYPGALLSSVPPAAGV